MSPPVVVAWLGYGGGILFGVLGIASLAAGRHAEFFSHALLGYSAVILSFVGALHWGFAMTVSGIDDTRRHRLFVWSVIPALLAGGALLLPSLPAAAVLILGFVAQYLMDRRLTDATTLPVWYLPLRLRLTAAACCSVALGALAA